MSTIQIQILRSEAELLDLKDDWNRLTESSEYPNVFTSWDWQTIWWKWFGRELRGEPFVLAVRNDKDLIGLVPFYRRRSFWPFFFGRKQLCFIGYGGLTCPEYLGPVVQKGKIEAVSDALVEFLQSHGSEWDSIFMEDYALDDPATVGLVDRLRDEFAEHSGEGESRYLISFPDGYDAYMKTLTSHNRQRKRVRLEKAQARYGARMEYPETENLKQWFSIIPDLTRMSRSRHGEATPFDTKTYAEFHRELLQTLLPQGRAVCGLLICDDEPAAIWYCFLLNEKCYAYQQGFNPKFEGSPSDVCQQHLLKHVADLGFKEFDFLRGLEWYKTSFANGSRPTRWTFFFRRRGLAYWSRLAMDLWARPWYRKLKSIFKKKEVAQDDKKHDTKPKPL